MRIAYIIADRGIPVFGAKGASIHVREMVNALAGLTHRVTLIAARYEQPCVPLAANLVTIDGGDEALTAISLPLDPEERTRLRESLAMRIGVAAVDTLMRLHRVEAFDLIYERYSLFSAAGVRAAQALDIPCFVEMNAPLLLEQRRFRNLVHIGDAEAIEAEVLGAADGVLTVSEEVRSYAMTKGARPARTHVIPNGVDPARFHSEVEAKTLSGLAGKFVVGFSGSLKPWHGIEVLMDAFRLLAARSSDYHLLVLGDGPLREWMEGYLSGASLNARVTMAGWVPFAELPGLLRTMDVAVAPYPAMDGFYFSPLKLYEYMAVGAPIVASKLGQIAQAIRHGETGLLVEPGDPVALANGIEHLRADPVLRTTLGARAARRAAAFTWTRNAQAVTDLAGRFSRPASDLTPTPADSGR